MKKFSPSTFTKACKALSAKHESIRTIVDTYGIPPLYSRPFGFDTLVQIILEQQVSLASGRAVFNRLQSYLGALTPGGLLQMDKDQLRACSVSRQKAGYLHHLSETVASGKLNLDNVQDADDDEVRKLLMQVKGIGPWTADVVLMLCLQRHDVFPIGDVALVNSVRHIHGKEDWPIADILLYSQAYAPYRTAAAYCYWHAYIQRKNISLG